MPTVRFRPTEALPGMPRITVAVLAMVIAVLGGCSSSGSGVGRNPGAGGTAAVSGSTKGVVRGSLTVLAASSLTDAFTTLAQEFEAAHPGTTVNLSFGASSTLAQQIAQGAPADVFASASPKNMQQVIDAGGASASSNFARNAMAIAVPPGNPATVTGVTDLARSGVKVALCQPQVPCGAAAAEVFRKAGIAVKPVTLEQDVRSTLTKVELNEVDAGMVFVTDVRTAGPKVKGIAIPPALNTFTEYPIATLTGARNAAGADAFKAFVLSPTGQRVLAADGFEQP